MAKNVLVLISGAPEGRNSREISIEAGTTAGDVLRALELPNYLLSREGSGQHWAETEEIYEAIPEGSKLRATPLAEVGGWWQDLLTWLFGPDQSAPVPPPPVVAPPRPVPVVVNRPARRPTRGVAVPTDTRPLWEVRGWRRRGDRLVGAFRIPGGPSYAGEISLDSVRPSFIIVDPPAAVLSGPHSSCFRARGEGKKFHIHFGVAHPDVDAGITAVEKLLVHAWKERR